MKVRHGRSAPAGATPSTCGTSTSFPARRHTNRDELEGSRHGERMSTTVTGSRWAVIRYTTRIPQPSVTSRRSFDRVATEPLPHGSAAVASMPVTASEPSWNAWSTRGAPITRSPHRIARSATVARTTRRRTTSNCRRCRGEGRRSRKSPHPRRRTSRRPRVSAVAHPTVCHPRSRLHRIVRTRPPRHDRPDQDPGRAATRNANRPPTRPADTTRRTPPRKTKPASRTLAADSEGDRSACVFRAGSGARRSPPGRRR
ncbi:hypothetical protein EHYA_09954 [Embleya hyalina]|uniref:Uncharacterized protein n=1 Tax=Embleya hyalina TaxID=516124 RepID=A0A401Z5Q8_9ACTN|nr:hypothetical protein EHYA_09954 [Embleya hyalina]